MAPAEHSTKTESPYDIFKVPKKGVREIMATDDIIESFTERTGISILRASKEGVLKDFNVESDFPEVLGAMLATVYGASVTAITDFVDGIEPVVKIETGKHDIAIIASNEDIIAAFVPEDSKLDVEILKVLGIQLEDSEY